MARPHGRAGWRGISINLQHGLDPARPDARLPGLAAPPALAPGRGVRLIRAPHSGRDGKAARRTPWRCWPPSTRGGRARCPGTPGGCAGLRRASGTLAPVVAPAGYAKSAFLAGDVAGPRPRRGCPAYGPRGRHPPGFMRDVHRARCPRAIWPRSRADGGAGGARSRAWPYEADALASLARWPRPLATPARRLQYREAPRRAALFDRRGAPVLYRDIVDQPEWPRSWPRLAVRQAPRRWSAPGRGVDAAA
jgi:hypothetical protein